VAEFDPAFDFMIHHEGGYVHDPADAGGETKYGISKRSYPNVDVANLTIESAKQIYRRDFWDPQPYGKISAQLVANKIFDMSVNMGFFRSHQIAQAAAHDCRATLQLKCDGVLGPATLAALNSIEPASLLAALRAGATSFYLELVSRRPSNHKFLNGWLARADS
jgi:lysozyme family protein